MKHWHFLPLALLAAAALTARPAQAAVEPNGLFADGKATWVSSTAGAPWVTQAIAVTSDTALPGNEDIVVNPQMTYQTISGFGGCFNELGWTALSALTPLQRTEVMQALFDPKTGCGFEFGRMPIGASDFARNWYSLDETPGDYALTDFSILRDQHCLIPYEKAALVVNPRLQIWGSAWSPPAWLKQNNDYHGGANTLKFEPAGAPRLRRVSGEVCSGLPAGGHSSVCRPCPE